MFWKHTWMNSNLKSTSLLLSINLYTRKLANSIKNNKIFRLCLYSWISSDISLTIYTIWWHNVQLIFVSSIYLYKYFLKGKDVGIFSGTKTLRRKIECKNINLGQDKIKCYFSLLMSSKVFWFSHIFNFVTSWWTWRLLCEVK